MPRLSILVVSASVLACALSPIASHAQTEKPPEPTATDKVIPEKLCPPGTEAGDPKCSLSNTLDQSGGVIVPPKGVDPGIVVPPAPVDTKMPVIAPPGSPGGNPGVQPKSP